MVERILHQIRLIPNFQNRVKIMTVNFNEASEESRQDHHSGARDFVFWNLPQVGRADMLHLKILSSGPAQESKCSNRYFQESNPKVIYQTDCRQNLMRNN